MIVEALGQEDLVLLHTATNGPATATSEMDIFRFEDGRLVEHWHVLQRVPDEDASANTMF